MKVALIDGHRFPLFLYPSPSVVHHHFPPSPQTETGNLESSLDNSTMFTSNAAVAKSLGKRKMREVGPETAAADLHSNGRRSRVQRILNNVAKPFSYMALLTADDEEGYPISDDIRNPCDQINQMIMSHNENLRQAVVGMLENTMAKRLKEKEMKLMEQERLVELYKGEAERLLMRVRYLEGTLQEEEEAESSFEDPDRMGLVRLDCKVCERKLANVMVWPCRHVCICTRCEHVI